MSNNLIDDETAVGINAYYDCRPSTIESVGWELADFVRKTMAASLGPKTYGSADAFMALIRVSDELRRLPVDANLKQCVDNATELLSVWPEDGSPVKDKWTEAAVAGTSYLLELSRHDNFAAARRCKRWDQFKSATDRLK